MGAPRGLDELVSKIRSFVAVQPNDDSPLVSAVLIDDDYTRNTFRGIVLAHIAMYRPSVEELRLFEFVEGQGECFATIIFGADADSESSS